ncbi:MAG: hypothetical protein DPW09_43755, partial [Anaerolineae bacterium]|nr:hypothetical protein [Anaerolineae bacterium]
FDPSLTKDLVESFTRWPAPLDIDPRQDELTKREAEVLHLVAWGKSNKEIAVQLGISVKTVEYHKANAVENWVYTAAPIFCAMPSPAAGCNRMKSRNSSV